jgi:hypothetical protein
MALTYEPIATSTVSSATASITFSSIAASWTDLRVVFVNTSTAGNQNASLTVNGDTNANYSFTRIKGNGTSGTSSRNTSANRIDMTADGTSTTIPQFFTIDIFSYTSSNYKGILIDSVEDKGSSGSVARQVALWSSTSVITSLTLTCNTSTWLAGTTATLYGILRA